MTQKKRNTLSQRFLTAARNGAQEEARALLKRGANIEARDKDGNTPLILAAEHGWDSIVQDLIDAGADIHTKNNINHSALIRATLGSHSEAACLLLIKSKIDINHKDNSNRNALFGAALSGKTKVVQELILAGADISTVSNDGYSAQDIATLAGHAHIAGMLYDEKDKRQKAAQAAEKALKEAAFEKDIEVIHKGLKKPIIISPPLKLKKRNP